MVSSVTNSAIVIVSTAGISNPYLLRSDIPERGLNVKCSFFGFLPGDYVP
jgi:hypothetical protein